MLALFMKMNPWYGYKPAKEIAGFFMDNEIKRRSVSFLKTGMVFSENGFFLCGALESSNDQFFPEQGA